MTPARPGELPRWLHSRTVVGAGIVLALLVVISAAAFVAFQRSALQAVAMQRTLLFARVLEDQANRTFNAVELALSAVADLLPGQNPDAAPVVLNRSTLQALPFLRSLSLLDADGRVLASTLPENLGHRVPPVRLRGVADHGLGTLQPGRDLLDLDKSAAPTPGTHLLPLTRPLPDGRLLVAAINPDYFSNQYPLMLAGEPLRAALLSYDATLLAGAGPGLAHEPGARHTAHTVFREWLPQREQGSFVGPGLDGAPALVAFRSARAHPLAVLVETPMTVVQAEVAQVQRDVALATAGVLAVVVALTALAWRSLHGHERVRDDLATARGTLAAQDAFTDRLFQVSPIPTVVKDSDGRIIRVNQAWSAFTGIAAERAVGRTLGALYPAHLAAPHEVQEQMALNAGQPASYEEQVLDADGLPRDVMVRVMPFGDAGGAADRSSGGVIVSLMDVTEFREAEVRTVEAKDAAERANAAKTEFLANISHELRTPLQTIIGFSELGQMRGRHEPKLHGMFGDILGAGRRMLALVNNLLDLSRIDSSIGDVDLVAMDLAPLVQALAHELRELAGARRLQLRLPDAPTALWAQADATRFAQVLRNLLANAIRFAPEGSAVEVDWLAAPEGGEHRLQVRDHGPGVPEAELESIFEPFVQSSRTKDGSGGTGLGLAICRRIMVAHQGAVRAFNHPQGGAVFELRMPAVAEVRVPQAATAA